VQNLNHRGHRDTQGSTRKLLLWLAQSRTEEHGLPRGNLPDTGNFSQKCRR